MRAFWEIVERIDRTAFSALDRVGQLRNKPSFRERTEKSIEHVRQPQRAIQFDA